MIDVARDADVAIIGLGVIGGSAALRLHQRGTTIRCYSTSTVDSDAASRVGLSVESTVDDAVRNTGLVLIAVPLDAICGVAIQVIGAAPSRATILHAGSLQRIEALQLLPEISDRVIGSHPVAGSHRTGFAAARPDLFSGATVFVERRADARQRENAELFWSLAGARHIEYAPAAVHDDAMAWFSHLPQLASTALGATLANAPAPDDAPSFGPGPGGRDATRLAMSALGMWRPLLERAPEATLTALGILESNIHELRLALEQRDWAALDTLWTRASTWRAAFVQGEGE
jgi:prephenate dehydrogenase